VLSRLAAALAAELTRASGEPWSPLDPAVGSIPKEIAAPAEVIVVGVLRVKVDALERSALLLASASLLGSRNGPRAESAQGRVGPLARALARMPMGVRPVLSAGAIRLRDLVDVSPGAVLMLDAGEGAPFDLRVEGQTIYRGHLTRSDSGLRFRVTWRRRSGAQRKEDR
jgi:flagellar motor switch/type III secretory pathway protein FliN